MEAHTRPLPLRALHATHLALFPDVQWSLEPPPWETVAAGNVGVWRTLVSFHGKKGWAKLLEGCTMFRDVVESASYRIQPDIAYMRAFCEIRRLADRLSWDDLERVADVPRVVGFPARGSFWRVPLRTKASAKRARMAADTWATAYHGSHLYSLASALRDGMRESEPGPTCRSLSATAHGRTPFYSTPTASPPHRSPPTLQLHATSTTFTSAPATATDFPLLFPATPLPLPPAPPLYF